MRDVFPSVFSFSFFSTVNRIALPKYQQHVGATPQESSATGRFHSSDARNTEREARQPPGPHLGHFKQDACKQLCACVQTD